MIVKSPTLFKVALYQAVILSVCCGCPAQERPAEITKAAKDFKLEMRREDSVGMFTKFDMISFLPIIGFEKNEFYSDDSKQDRLNLEKQTDGKYASEMKKLVDHSQFFREAVNTLLPIGKSNLEWAINNFPEIIASDKSTQVAYESGKIGRLMLMLTEGYIDGKRVIILEITASGRLKGESDPRRCSVNLYSRETPIESIERAGEASKMLIKKFYEDFTASRTARSSGI